jgi:thioredoxin 2
MNDESIIAICPKCGAKNRVPRSRWTDRLKCGKCKESLDLQNLYPGKTTDVTDATFQREVIDFRGPVLVDFTAPW